MNGKPKRYLMYIAQNYAYSMLRPLQTEILSQGGEVAWFLEGDQVSPGYLRENEVRLMSIREIKEWAPDAVFVPGNVVPHFIPGIKVGVFHGFNSGKRGDERGHFNIRGFFDLYCTQGPDTTHKFQMLAKRHGFFKVVETGWPNLDPLFLPEEKNPYISVEDSRPTVLLCSTFSEKLSCAPIVFDTVKALANSGKWRWLVQFHPKMDPAVVEKYKSIQSSNLQFVETDNVLPLLKAADVMLCDTSSMLIMFLLQGKPVVTFRNQSPGKHLIDITKVSDIEGAIERALAKPSDTMSAIDNFCNLVHPYKDGNSSQRVLEATDLMIKSGLKRLKPKPLNLVRKFKLRKKLNYWGR